MDQGWIMCPIRFEYNPQGSKSEDFMARIIDHYGSNIRNQVVTNIKVPEYCGDPFKSARMDNVLENLKGLEFMRVITGLDLPKGKLADKLVSFSKRKITDQWVSTPHQESRQENPVTSLRLSCLYGGDFRVNCHYDLYHNGYAFLVSKD